MKKLFLFLIFCCVFSPGFAFGSASQKVEIVYFYSSHCKVCHQLKNEFLPVIEKRYDRKIDLKKLNIDQPENFRLLLGAVELFHRKGAATPSLVIGDNFLVGKYEIENKLDFLVYQYLRGQGQTSLKLKGKDAAETFARFSPLAVLSAGLIDGVNPCAFAVVVFFISFLSVYGYSKREVVLVGLSYVLSVFITYILIGMGLFSLFYSLKNFYVLMKTFYYLVAGGCFVLFVLALYDYFRYKKEKTSQGMLLQLPAFLKKKVTAAIGSGLRGKKNSRAWELCAISFSLGFAVSLLEAACTGQVYLPTIMAILKMPELKMRAFFYLVLYNLMFIVPLVLVFLLALLGVSSQQFSDFLKRKLGALKLAMAGLFLVLGVLVLALS